MCFHVPNNEFFRNLAWTLWVPIGFTTASIKYLGWFWLSWFHGVPLWNFSWNMWMTPIKKTKGKSRKSKSSQIFDTQWCDPYGYPKCLCQVSKKFIIRNMETRWGYTIWRYLERPLLIDILGTIWVTKQFWISIIISNILNNNIPVFFLIKVGQMDLPKCQMRTKSDF